ncbi:hypothetical protein [Nostoc sp. 106C]|nr:hypothetical protein [Nostoc sp. 106C]
MSSQAEFLSLRLSKTFPQSSLPTLREAAMRLCATARFYDDGGI